MFAGLGSELPLSNENSYIESNRTRSKYQFVVEFWKIDPITIFLWQLLFQCRRPGSLLESP
jgi:hypothetical protein